MRRAMFSEKSIAAGEATSFWIMVDGIEKEVSLIVSDDQVFLWEDAVDLGEPERYSRPGRPAEGWRRRSI